MLHFYYSAPSALNELVRHASDSNLLWSESSRKHLRGLKFDLFGDKLFAEHVAETGHRGEAPGSVHTACEISTPLNSIFSSSDKKNFGLCVCLH